MNLSYKFKRTTSLFWKCFQVLFNTLYLKNVIDIHANPTWVGGRETFFNKLKNNNAINLKLCNNYYTAI